IPVDGVVLEGSASLDESALTGESVTVPKIAGDNVSTATDIVSGEIICRAEKVGEDTVLSRIIQMVTDATSTKAPIARVADRVAGIFVPVVLGIAAVTALVWALLGYEAGHVLNRAISVLVISCPCALGLATPVAIMVGTGLGSKKGILFKTAESLEQTGKPELIVLDKTGTVTEGKVGADTVKADSAAGIKELKKLGLNVIMLSGDKKERAEIIASQVGIEYCISQVLPGDKGMVIKSLKEQLGGESAGVIMVGDGINDAPALKTAHIGMAIGAGKDIAIDAADVVLMNSSLRDVAAAIRLSRRTLLNIKENLFWAFIYNIICIPLAAGVYSVLLHWDMSPMVGAACMALSSVCVCLNALRLNLFDPYKEGREKRAPKLNIDVDSLTGTNIPKEYTENSEVKNMEKIMKIEGMMCTHCSGRVKGVLEALDGVDAAEVSHETGEAVLTLSADVADEILAKAVTDAGYTVVG
ncbi:MAG: HAD-IC family P-type ATPase, partial [Parasporobacterium sp.]|nr:HAD-IC family P-type ATPase [Parasporobacterium sp.]